MNLNLSHLTTGVRTLKSVITANSPVLLVGTAVVGVVATGVLAARAGYNARGIVDEARAESIEEPTVQEKIKLTWLCYAAPALTGASAVASVVGVHTIHTKRHAALAGVLAVTSTKLEDYKTEAEKLLTPKKQQELNDAVSQKSVDRQGPGSAEVIITGHGPHLFLSEWEGRYFRSSLNKVEEARLDANRKLLEEGSIDMNEFYDKLGLGPTAMGQMYGWSGRELELVHGNATSEDGEPCHTISFRQEPEKNCGLSRRN